MTIQNWRKHVRNAHKLASTGDRAAIDRLGVLMRHKRTHELKPARRASRQQHSDEVVWRTYLESDRSLNKTALKLGYAYWHVSNRLRKIRKARAIGGYGEGKR